MKPEGFSEYVLGRLPDLWLRTGEHLMLTGLSTLAAICLGLPLAILLFRVALLRNPAIGVIGMMQTIPSLAMLAFLLALLQKIGVLPALIALTIYALLPIVRNTLTGLLGISPEVVEAARGIGMTWFQQLSIVRIPMAMPVILTGIRTAAVVGVGIATLSAFIGAGGLGQFINRGLALSNMNLILLGAVPAALLALIVDFSLGALEWGLRPIRKRDRRPVFKFLIRPAALCMPFMLIVCGGIAYFTRPAPATGLGALSETLPPVIRIASKNFTEQIILGEIMAQLIEARTEMRVARRFNLGGTMICHHALIKGEIDLYAEYTGTALISILNENVVTDPDQTLRIVSEQYSRQFGLTWLEPFGFNNTYALTVRAADSKAKGWQRISDLEEAAPALRAGFTAEFAERPDGYPGIQRVYGLAFGDVRDLDPSLMYDAISEGGVDVICAFATDGRIASFRLVPLEDDRLFFPPYYAAPVVRSKILHDHPELGKALSLLAGVLDDETMQRLNFEVDGEKQSPSAVAKGFLISKGLLW